MTVAGGRMTRDESRTTGVNVQPDQGWGRLDFLRKTGLHAVFVCGPDLTVSEWDETAASLFGYSAEEALGRGVDELLGAVLGESGQAPGTDTVDTVVSAGTQSVRVRTRAGKQLECLWTCGPEIDDVGRIVGVTVFVEAVSPPSTGAPPGLSRNMDPEEADRIKATFLAGMSHELRTPLNAIIGFANVLLEPFWGALNSKQKEYIHEILGSGKALLSLINRLLDLAMVEAGKYDINIEPGDLSIVFRQAGESVLKILGVREQTLETRIAVDFDGKAMIDHDALIHLLENAVGAVSEMVPRGGRITLRARRRGPDLQVLITGSDKSSEVSDPGAAWDVNQAGERVDPLWVDKSLRQMLARRLAKLFGGSIRFETARGGAIRCSIHIPVDETAVFHHQIQTVIEEARSSGERFALCRCILKVGAEVDDTLVYREKLLRMLRTHKRSGDLLLRRHDDSILVFRHVGLNNGSAACARLRKEADRVVQEVSVEVVRAAFPGDGVTVTELMDKLMSQGGPAPRGGPGTTRRGEHHG